MVENAHLFLNLPYTRYAAACRVQKSNSLPSLSFIKANKYYSEERKLYRFKSKASVLPISLCLIHQHIYLALYMIS